MDFDFQQVTCPRSAVPSGHSGFLPLLIKHQAEMTEINESVPNNVMFDWLID
jgi:hypothetical protein